MATSLELDGPESIRRAELSVLADGPFLRLDVIPGEATFILLILEDGDAGCEPDMLTDQTSTATPMGVFGAGYDVNTFSFIKRSFYPGFLSLSSDWVEAQAASPTSSSTPVAFISLPLGLVIPLIMLLGQTAHWKKKKSPLPGFCPKRRFKSAMNLGRLAPWNVLLWD